LRRGRIGEISRVTREVWRSDSARPALTGFDQQQHIKAQAMVCRWAGVGQGDGPMQMMMVIVKATATVTTPPPVLTVHPLESSTPCHHLHTLR
jgi:hypothetical protein